MPIYEYRCHECSRISSHLVLNVKEFEPFCSHCGSKSVKKLISRVRVRLSEETRLERLMDPTMLGGLDESDPKTMAKWMKKMGSLAGDDLGEDFDQMVDEAVEEAASGDQKTEETD
ncbi:FmdB family zinc ribbon protein [Dissulfuribacter thermophilus]|nr:zinc ribbon domain-containing protein [Dissulfuribacter thermophilus]